MENLRKKNIFKKIFLGPFALSLIVHCIVALLLFFLKEHQPLLPKKNKEKAASHLQTLNVEWIPKTPHLQNKKKKKSQKFKAMQNIPVPTVPTAPKKENFTKKDPLHAFLPQNSEHSLIQEFSFKDPFMPQNHPQIKERFLVQNLASYQFREDFKTKFSAIWNLEERWVPPESSLQAGDVVFYKFYIQKDGTLQKFENLSRARHRDKDYSVLDTIMAHIIAQVFPLTIPDVLQQNPITEVIAIQVVGPYGPIRYSFE